MPKVVTKASATSAIGETTFSELESFSDGPNIFPLGKQIAGRYNKVIKRQQKGISKSSAIHKVAQEIKDQWDKGNVPSQTTRIVEGLVTDLLNRIHEVRKREKRYEKKAPDWFLTDKARLVTDLENVLDIKLPDDEIGAAEKILGIPYGEEERALYQDQISKTFKMRLAGVDKEWESTHDAKIARKEKKEEAERQQKEKWDRDKAEQFATATISDNEENLDMSQDEEDFSTEMDGQLEGSSNVVQKVVVTRAMQRQFELTGEIEIKGKEYLRVRDSYRKVRNDVYDFLVDFMAEGSASTKQCLIAAQKFAKHILKVNWYLEEEAKKLKEKADSEGPPLPEDFYDFVLPSETAFIEMRKNYAIAAEKKTSELIVDSEDVTVTQHGDSTTRRMVGKVFTTPFTVSGKFGTRHFNVPIQKITSETAEDVADVYELTYERMGILTDRPAAEVFGCLDSMMTDAASEMHNFIPILSDRLKSEHKPVRLECVMHTVLGFTNAALKVLSTVEQAIGPSNLFGTSKCHDSTNVVKSTVNAVMKFISPQFIHKPYNKKEDFDALLKSKGQLPNYAFAYRSCRFGAIEKASIVVLHHCDNVVDLSERVENRNDLIIFLRTVMECLFIKNMLIALSLFGLHVIEPFIKLVEASSHVELQKALPALFADLQNHQEFSKKAISISESALPTLKDHFGTVLDKGVYKESWLKSLQAEIDILDDASLDSIRKVLGLFSFQCSATLERQRGSAYDFGSQQGVQKDKVSSIPKDKLEKMPVTNLRAENEFGSIDTILTRLTTNSVRLVSDHRVLRTAGGLVYGTGIAREMGPYKERLKLVPSAFDEKQLKHKEDNLKVLSGKARQYEKRNLQLLDVCKSAGGPFTTPDQVTAYVTESREKGLLEAGIKKVLKANVMYDRETMTKRPKTDDVFRIRDRATHKDLTADQFRDNLVTLLSNILAVADVPNDLVQKALDKAATAVGIQYICDAQNDVTAESLVEVEEQTDATGLIDSPNSDHCMMEHVAFAFVDDSGKKTWCLSMVECIKGEEIELSLCKPVPGRMGEHRVAFFPPEEDEMITAKSSDILPIPLIISESMLGSDTVFIVNNHEEVDGFLKVVPKS